MKSHFNLYRFHSPFKTHCFVCFLCSGPTACIISWPTDALWRQRSGSALAQVKACCLVAPNQSLNFCLAFTWAISKDLFMNLTHHMCAVITLVKLLPQHPTTNGSLPISSPFATLWLFHNSLWHLIHTFDGDKSEPCNHDFIYLTWHCPDQITISFKPSSGMEKKSHKTWSLWRYHLGHIVKPQCYIYTQGICGEW